MSRFDGSVTVAAAAWSLQSERERARADRRAGLQEVAPVLGSSGFFLHVRSVILVVATRSVVPSVCVVRSSCHVLVRVARSTEIAAVRRVGGRWASSRIAVRVAAGRVRACWSSPPAVRSVGEPRERTASRRPRLAHRSRRGAGTLVRQSSRNRRRSRLAARRVIGVPSPVRSRRISVRPRLWISSSVGIFVGQSR